MLNVKDKLIAQFDDTVVLTSVDEGLYPFLEIASDKIVEVCAFLTKDENCYFDYLSNLTGVDLMDENKIEIIYDLVSIPFEQKLTLKVRINRESPAVDSISSVWKSADWHEREVFDLLGVKFNNHPDLRRILMPTNWKGYPLRKDYEDAEKYHGVKIKY
jgi:NADH-quinone oxidoreductase subunit C